MEDKIDWQKYFQKKLTKSIKPFADKDANIICVEESGTIPKKAILKMQDDKLIPIDQALRRILIAARRRENEMLGFSEKAMRDGKGKYTGGKIKRKTVDYNEKGAKFCDAISVVVDLALNVSKEESAKIKAVRKKFKNAKHILDIRDKLNK